MLRWTVETEREGTVEPAVVVTILGAGAFFLTALLCGTWKFLEIWASPTGQAHVYVDIAHRTALLYAYACVLLALFAHVSQLSGSLELAAALVPIAFFAAAVASYVLQGVLKRTDNQFRRAAADRPGSRAALYGFMWALVLGEIGGFLVLFYGVIDALVISGGFP